MGRLSLDINPIDPFTMNTATVSLWFHVLSASMEEAHSSNGSLGGFYKVLLKALPLLMWGEQLLDAASGGPLGPSYIAIGANEDLPNTPNLMVNIQTEDFATGAGFNDFVPQRFGNEASMESGLGGYPGPIALDAWHHLFLSWALTTSESAGDSGISGLSTMYCMLDGVDQSGASLPALCPAELEVTPSGGANNMCSDAAGKTSGGPEPDFMSSLTVSKIKNSPLVIPGFQIDSEAGSRSNIKVQLGMLQIFGGLMLTPDNIGLFVNGRRPTKPDKAELALSVTPHVRLSTQEEWLTGTNTGSLGNFMVTGSIGSYVPPGVIEFAA